MSKVDSEDWFVAQLKPQGLRRAQENLQRQKFDTFVPKRTESALSGGKRVSKEMPLFPGYLFVRFDPERSGWLAINSTYGVARLIVQDIRKPRPLPSSFMAGLMARCDESGLIGAPPDLSAGDSVRILSGPFAETIATIETLQAGERIQILMDLMGRAVRTSVAANRVQKL